MMKFKGFENRTAALMILSLILAALVTHPISAQQKRPQPQPTRPPAQTSSPPEQGSPSVFTDVSKDYLISPGDVIEIQVEDAPELSRNHQVTSAGYIEMMPVLGQVIARGKTSYELARVIADGLREQEYLKSPNVVVTVRQFNSRAFFIQGAVQKPGLYQVEGRPSLLTLIGLAGGLSESHGSTVFILRPSKTQNQSPDAQNSALEARSPAQTAGVKPASLAGEDSADSETTADYELMKINLSALYKGRFDQNQRLEPGDIVNIPRADVFFVAGEVRAPGSFVLKDGTTLRQAISLAQGMTFKAKASQGIIFREDPTTGSRQEVKVDIGAVMSGKKEDIVVQANDVIIIPNSQVKAVGGAILMSLGVNSIRLPIY
jgi:polysaccharide biosynthesis/export protein